jgi:hypothetical protein
MAQVRPQTQATIGWQLDWSLWQWSRLPQVEAEIDSWDLLDQLHFIEEWPLEEERLLRLERYAAENQLEPEQLTRYAELKRFVARHRPIIRRLQQS